MRKFIILMFVFLLALTACDGAQVQGLKPVDAAPVASIHQEAAPAPTTDQHAEIPRPAQLGRLREFLNQEFGGEPSGFGDGYRWERGTPDTEVYKWFYLVQEGNTLWFRLGGKYSDDELGRIGEQVNPASFQWAIQNRNVIGTRTLCIDEQGQKHEGEDACNQGMPAYLSYSTSSPPGFLMFAGMATV